MRKFWVIALFMAGIVLLSLLDIGINLVGIVFPIIGASVESVSEVTLEALQLLLTGLAFLVIGGDN